MRAIPITSQLSKALISVIGQLQIIILATREGSLSKE